MIVPNMIECVPNFSEGRDRAKVEEIVQAIASASGVRVLGWEADADHHRSVVTFAGEAEAVLEGAVRGVGKAAQLIDLNAHHGVHPRVGAADVVPFVPLEGSSLDDCAITAHRAGAAIWKRFGVPVYFYGAAALRTGRERLEKVRRAGFDGLPPDEGEIPQHVTAGAAVVGARKFLIAFNVRLKTTDVAVAKAIASRIRESSGGFRHVKALGLYLESHQCAQVSMNLIDFTQTDLNAVYSAIATAAEPDASELIGFVPKAAYENFPEFFARAEGWSASRIVEVAMERQS